jgi:hypothetical protein
MVGARPGSYCGRGLGKNTAGTAGVDLAKADHSAVPVKPQVCV